MLGLDLCDKERPCNDIIMTLVHFFVDDGLQLMQLKSKPRCSAREGKVSKGAIFSLAFILFTLIFN